MATPQPPLDWRAPIVEADGTPTTAFQRLWATLTGASGAANRVTAPLGNHANDAAAAAAGVAVDSLYRNGSVVMVRVV